MIVFLLILSLVLVLSPAAFAADDWELVEDLAGILTREQRDALQARAEAISARHRCDVIIVTLGEMIDDDGAYEWARYIYTAFGYGYGSDRSGVLFFLSMAERDFALVAYGYGHTAFTDYGKDVMLDDHILPLLRENKYYEAFSAYLDVADDFLAMARDGTPFDRDSSGSLVVKLAITILVPLLVALIICSMWKKQMKTAVAARAAANYIPPGGFNITGQKDMFMYKTTDRKKIETQQSKSGGGTTVDSKGFSGRSGKF